MNGEIWDLYDAERKKTGLFHRRGEPLPLGFYHLVVKVWIVNQRGEFLITRRDLNRPMAGLWEYQGGSALAGEDSLTAALREAKEETGLTLPPDGGEMFHTRFADNGSIYDSWLFRFEYDLSEIVLQDGETVDAKKATFAEIEELMKRGEFRERHADFDILLDRAYRRGGF
jgi:8-oxo-dGTP pyrophosphatase MutT (NUDIX family)